MSLSFTVRSLGGPASRASQARLGRHTVDFDMPVRSGGTGTAPGPLAVFVAAAGGCAHFFASGALVEAGVDTTDLAVTATGVIPEDGPVRLSHVTFEVTLPEGVDGALADEVLAAVRRCPVHRTLTDAPGVEVRLADAAEGP